MSDHHKSPRGPQIMAVRGGKRRACELPKLPQSVIVSGGPPTGTSERSLTSLSGIFFSGPPSLAHPLSRDWEGYPLRKD